jgi:WD40 repeat protein
MALAFTPDSKKLISATKNDHTLKIWDTATGKEIRTIRDPGPEHEVPVLSVTADGKKLLAWVHDAKDGVELIEVYDLASSKRLESYSAHERPLASLAYSADGELAATGGVDGTVRIWEVAKKERLPGGDLAAHQDAIFDLIFTPDKKFLITIGNDGQVKVWDISKRTVAKLEPTRTLPARKPGVIAFAMSSDAKRFVTAGADNKVILWDAASGKELRTWDYHAPPGYKKPLLRSLAFTPDGKYVVTANVNTTLFLLECP